MPPPLSSWNVVSGDEVLEEALLRLAKRALL